MKKCLKLKVNLINKLSRTENKKEFKLIDNNTTIKLNVYSKKLNFIYQSKVSKHNDPMKHIDLSCLDFYDAVAITK